MKTLLALEELIRSYNGITALDNFKAIEALKVLKELDLKYEGFGEDKEISSRRLLEEYLEDKNNNAVCTDNKRYFDFSPKGYNVLNQNRNCLIELHNSTNKFYVTDKQIVLLYEMISDIYEYGEINDTYKWKSEETVSNLEIHDVSNQNNCIISLNYDNNICDLINTENSVEENISDKTQVILNMNTYSLAKVLKRILLNFKIQNAGTIAVPAGKEIKYSEALVKTLSSVRYLNVLTALDN